MIRPKNILRMIALLLVLLALGLAGKYDYTEEVIRTLSYRQYTLILRDLGGNASDMEIVDYYRQNRDYYDAFR